jgi:ferric iron reductase protein FhuF
VKSTRYEAPLQRPVYIPPLSCRYSPKYFVLINPSLCLLPLLWETEFHTHTKQEVKLQFLYFKSETHWFKVLYYHKPLARWDRGFEYHLGYTDFEILYSVKVIHILQHVSSTKPLSEFRFNLVLIIYVKIFRIHFMLLRIFLEPWYLSWYSAGLRAGRSGF